EEHFKGGEFDGEYIAYYSTGQVKEKGAFQKDKRTGDYIAYFQNGAAKEKAAYRDGKLVGKFYAYPAPDEEYADDYPEDVEEKDITGLMDDLADYNKKKDK
ncbi:MAG: hypothetical protein HGB33_10100, partial [Syntrophaceae bacterium]|nr:hypothetical protein [Syntrophaceae bacterium]